MKELDRVGDSDDFNIRSGGGGPSFLEVCEKQRRWNVCTVMALLHV